MAMEHKAFVLDYNAFDRELRPVLERALSSRDISALIAFITANIGELTDPYEGDPLGEDWEAMIETQDTHQYGDFALTKYYQPTADIGLGASWEYIQELIANDPALTESPILGTPIGPKDNFFDPGMMGAYFQTAEQVRQHYKYLVALQRQSQDDDILRRAVRMLAQARNSEKGLYVTF
jgi:hypothetical protein